MLPTDIVNWVSGALAVAVLTLALLAFLESRRLRLEEERKVVYREETDLKRTLMERLAKEIEGSGVDLSARELASLWVSAIVLPVLIMGAAGQGAGVIIGAGALGAALPPLALHAAKRRNRRAFEEQLGQTMPLIAANLRGGAALRNAITPVADNMGEPVRGEFRILTADIGRGMPVPEALDRMAERNKSEDLRLFASAVRAQEAGGGNLSDIVETVGRTIRARVAIRAEVRSKTSQGRATALIMVIVPPALGCVIALMNSMYMDYYKSPMGLVTIIVCAVFEAAGYMVCRKICDIKTD